VDNCGLLETPADLCCPLTKQLYKDPVITTAGQVYERSAIMHHLQSSHQDPVSGEAISPDRLTPVVMLRKGAQHYRDATVAACVEEACSTACQEPVRFLRRAMELSSDNCRGAPGLTLECATYLRTHQSNAYDVYALQIFAQALQNGGYHDQAASVFNKLLHMGEDRAQQAGIMKQCIAFWVQECSPGQEDHAVVRLAEFVRSQPTLSWTQIVDIMCEASVSHKLVSQTCELLLLQSCATEEDRSFKELFVKYARLRLNSIKARMGRLEDCVAELQLLDASPATAPQASSSPATDTGRQHRQRHSGRPWQPWTAAALLVGAVVHPSHTLLHLARVVTVLVITAKR
jgi:hypothetical protein